MRNVCAICLGVVLSIGCTNGGTGSSSSSVGPESGGGSSSIALSIKKWWHGRHGLTGVTSGTDGGATDATDGGTVTAATDGGVSAPDLATAADLAQPSNTGGTTGATGGTTGTTGGTTGTTASGPGTHTRCGWIDTYEGYTQFENHAAEYQAIHPHWYTMQSDGISLGAAGTPNDSGIRAAAAAAKVQVIPFIDAAHDVVRQRLMINSATNRAAHVAAILAAVDQNKYDGIEIDYEGLWNDTDRAGFEAFLTLLAQGLHARGKELAVDVEGLRYAAGAFSYEDLSAIADTVHIMGYDFHNVDSHMGPIAPLGWIDAALSYAQSTGRPSHFVLGIANYAIGTGYWTTTADAMSQCTQAIQTTTDHMLTCSFGNDAPGRAPHCTTASHGTLWFEDLGSMEEKMQSVVAHGARGINYWTVGSELNGYYTLARKYFP